MKRELFEYEIWANNEVIRAILALEDPPEKVLSIMSHVINAQILWLSRIQGEICNVKVWQLYDKNELNKINQQAAGKLDEYIRSISENELERTVSYKNTKGDNFQSSVSDIFIHLTHHSSYHRGQVVMLLKDEISTLPYVDYIHYVRSIKSI